MDAPPVPAIVGPDAVLEFDADADTASVLTANDEPAAKKSKKEAGIKDVPESINDVDRSMSHRFVFGQRVPPPSRAKNAPAQPRIPVEVLIEVVTKDGRPNVVVDDLPQAQFRALSVLLGVPNSSRSTKWSTTVAMTDRIRTTASMDEQFDTLRARGDSARAARSVAAGDIVGDGAAPVVAPVAVGRDNSSAVPEDTESNDVQLAWNSIARLSNVLFSGPFQDAFLALNDNRDRHQQEFGFGPKGEHFWSVVAKQFIVVADGAQDHFGDLDLSLTVGSNPDILDRFTKTTVDPSVFIPLDELQPSKLEKQLEKWTKELISLRKEIKGPNMMGKSGTNDSDIYNFVKQGAIKRKCLTKMGIFPIYYFLLHADRLPNFDSKFMPFLAKGMHGSSLKPGEAPDASARRRKSTGDDNAMVAAMNRFVETQNAELELKKESVKADARMQQLQARKLTLEQRSLERKLALEEHELLMHQWEKVKAVMSTLEEGSSQYESFKTMESELRSQMVAAVVAVPADPQASASASASSGSDSS